MSKRLVMAVIFVVIISQAVSCRKTPDRIVRDKSDFDLCSVIDFAGQQHVTAPETADLDIENRDGIVIAQIHAKVILPPAWVFPVYRLLLRNFDQRQIKTIARCLTDGAEIYQMTMGTDKNDIQMEIGWRQRKIDELQRRLDERDGNAARIRDEIQIEMDNLERLYAEYQTAPDLQPVLSDLLPQPVSDGAFSNYEELLAQADLSNRSMAYIQLRNYPNGYAFFNFDNSGRDYSGYANGQWSLAFGDEFEISDTISQMRISVDEGMRKADDIVRMLGIGEYDCYDSALWIDTEDADSIDDLLFKDQYYLFYYRKAIGGIPVNTAVDERATALGQADERTGLLSAEMLKIALDEEHVAAVYFSLPYDAEKLIDNVEIIPYPEAFDTCRGYLLASYDVNRGKAYITDIELVYQKVLVRDSDDIALIPVWNFMGRYIGPADEQNKGDQAYQPADRKTIAAVNAIDGTIIDRAAGY